jgi:hypothetical protein
VRRLVVAALLVVIPGVAAAQGNTAEQLDQAARYHADLDVERELVLLRRIISPNSPFVVTHEQRVLAYKYLGAALVVSGRRDSAIVYFSAALERDPFVDLEPQKFTPAELAAFADARRLTFGLGIRAVPFDTLDPRTERLGITVLATHAADIHVELRTTNAPAGVVLYQGITDGPRELQWDGLIADGHLAPTGRYELFLSGVSRLSHRADSVRLYFSVQQEHAPLEDTLPALRPDEVLPEQHSAGIARAELLKGLGIAAGALLIPRTLANGDLHGGGRALATGIAVTASGAGIAGFVFRQRHREISANVAANARRRAEHAAANAAIRDRNQQRLAQTRLIVAPAAGVGP